jgi:hypothetical protein
VINRYSESPFGILATAADKTRNPDTKATLDRQADLWLALGRHDTAERLSHLAADLRQGAAA